MANDNAQTSNPTIYPVRAGGIPTPDGIFPVSPTGGGTRRRRRPMIDIALYDAKAKIVDQDDLLEMAWGIIANAHGGRWEQASHEWQDAAAKWRDRYFASAEFIAKNSGDTKAATDDDEEISAADELAKNETAVIPDELPPLADFLARLSVMPIDEVKKEVPEWDGSDETFVDAVTTRWELLKPLHYKISSTGQEGIMQVVPTEMGGLGVMDKVHHEITKAPEKAAQDDEDAEEMRNLRMSGGEAQAPPQVQQDAPQDKPDASQDKTPDAPQSNVPDVPEPPKTKARAAKAK